MKKIVFDKGWGANYHNLTILLGNFDGVHLGHYELVKEAKKKAEGELAVLLFSSSPASLLHHKSAKVLTSLEDKIRLFASFGFDYAFVLPLSIELLNKSKDEFIKEYLMPLSPSLFVIGEDYSFGKEAKGNKEDLEQVFNLSVVPLKYIDGKKVGTREIISFLNEGDVKSAATYLGRPYEIKGKVARGFGNGHKLNFPTANLDMDDPYLIPKSGVYETLTYLKGRPYHSLTNIGTNPTFSLLSAPSVETYIEGLDEDIYDLTIYVSFLSYVREERKFENIEALKRQIEEDKKSIDLHKK